MYEQEHAIVNSKSFPNVIPSKIICAISFFDEHRGCARSKMPAGSQMIVVGCGSASDSENGYGVKSILRYMYICCTNNVSFNCDRIQLKYNKICSQLQRKKKSILSIVKQKRPHSTSVR